MSALHGQDKTVQTLQDIFENSAKSLSPEESKEQQWEIQKAEAMRYGVCSEQYMESRLMLGSRFISEGVECEMQLGELKEAIYKAKTLAAAWIQLLQLVGERHGSHKTWRVGILETMTTHIKETADPSGNGQALYARLEEFNVFLEEAARRTNWRQTMANFMALYAEHCEVVVGSDNAYPYLDTMDITMRYNEELVHRHRRIFEDALIARANALGITSMEYRPCPVDPVQGYGKVMKLLGELQDLHGDRPLGVPLSSKTRKADERARAALLIANLELAQSTAAAARAQQQANWILTEIRQKLRPDGARLVFEDNVERFYNHGQHMSSAAQPQVQQMAYAPQTKLQRRAVVQEQEVKPKSSSWCC